MSVIGWLASLVMRTDARQGVVLNVVVGIVGALLGGYIGRALGFYRGNDPVGFVMAVIGSIILLVIYRFVARRPGVA